MKIFLFFSFFIICFLLFSCNNTGLVNEITNLSTCDSEIVVRKWFLTKPILLDRTPLNSSAEFKEPTCVVKDLGDTLEDFESFTDLYPEIAENTAPQYPEVTRFPYYVAGNYLQVNRYFKNSAPANCYAACIIKSDKNQDVALISSADNGIKLWVNKKLCIASFGEKTISAYQYTAKVRLKKGNNFILAKLHNSGKSPWNFLLKLSSIKYANENSLGTDYASFCENYLIKENDALSLKMRSPFISTKRGIQVEISAFNTKSILIQKFPPGKQWKLSLKGFKTGPYTIKLKTNSGIFYQSFFYGDHLAYVSSIKKNMLPNLTNDKINKHAALLLDSFKNLYTLKPERDHSFDRIIAARLFAIGQLYHYIKNNQRPLAHVPGLHLRTQDSKLYSGNSYMLFIPEAYRKNKKLPLVIMMPDMAFLHPLNTSLFLTETDRTEFESKLARKYGFAIVWPYARTDNRSVLNNKTPSAVFEILEDLKKDYTIDEDRIYAYGSGTGGSLTLFTANKYPSLFAAIGIEGPAVDDKNLDTILSTVKNYNNTPLYIIHSQHDKKASLRTSQRLVKSVAQSGGFAELKTLQIIKDDTVFANLMPYNKITTDLFAFYDGKTIEASKKQF